MDAAEDGSGRAGSVSRFSGAPFKLLWRQIADPGVPPMSVVPSRQPGEDGSAGFLMGPEAIPLQHLGLQA